MTFRSPITFLLTGVLSLCLLFGAEVAHAQPASVADVHVFLSPNSSNTFELAEPTWAILYFDRAVAVTGVPQLEITIGTRRRPAPFVGMALTSRPALLFRYTMAASSP